MADTKVEMTRPVSSPSPPPNCAICLGSYANKCFSDSCMHQFCFKCLLEWSKIKAECPLCKQPFKSIIHNVKSNEEYDEHVVENLPNTYHLPAQPARHQFHFRTTFTVDTRGEHAIQQMLLTHPLTNGGHISIAGFSPRRSLHHRRRYISATSFRRSIYSSNLWVNAPPDVTGRYRDVSPAFFRNCPNARTRLVPWLNRELTALLYDNTQLIEYLVDRVMDYLLRHHICSRAFRNLLSGYLGNKTDHFVHEFYNFMRSPFDMFGYDRHIIYTERPRSPAPFIDVSDNDSDSDVILVSATNPDEPVVIDLVNTDSDEPILVSTENPPVAPLAMSDEELNRPPILPLKLRLKHKRQSKQKRSRTRKRRHRSTTSSSSSSSSSQSSSASEKFDDESYRRHKRKRKLKRKSKKREVYVISSDNESPVNDAGRKPIYTDSDDDLPLSAFANKKKHKKPKRKHKSKNHGLSSASKDYTYTKKDSPNLEAAATTSNLPTCSKYYSDSSISRTPPLPGTSNDFYGRELSSTLESSEKSPTSLVSQQINNYSESSERSGTSSIANLPSCSRYSTMPYATSQVDPRNADGQLPSVSRFPIFTPSPTSSTSYRDGNAASESDDSSYGNGFEHKPIVKSEIREVKNEIRHNCHATNSTNHSSSSGSSNSCASGGGGNNGRLMNILIKKEESSNLWYTYPCAYNSDTSEN